MSASLESSRSSCCSGCWSAVASSLAPTRSGPAGQPLPILHLSLYSKQRNAGKSRLKELTFLTVFINTVLEGWGRYTDLLRVDYFCIHFPDFLHTYLCKRVVTISIKSWFFLRNPRKSIPFYEYRTVLLHNGGFYHGCITKRILLLQAFHS
jgi:hypothetical protein